MDLSSMMKLYTGSQAKEKSLQKSLDKIKIQMQEARSKMVELNQNLSIEIEDKKRLSTKWKKDKVTIIEQHLQETKKLKQEFIVAQAEMNEQMDVLRLKIQDIQNKYDQRESREEDIERIRVVEEENIMMRKELKKLMKDVQFYKLELVNREQNFNKMFGSKPVVGNMLSVSRKPSSASKVGNLKKANKLEPMQHRRRGYGGPPTSRSSLKSS